MVVGLASQLFRVRHGFPFLQLGRGGASAILGTFTRYPDGLACAADDRYTRGMPVGGLAMAEPWIAHAGVKLETAQNITLFETSHEGLAHQSNTSRRGGTCQRTPPESLTSELGCSETWRQTKKQSLDTAPR